MSLKRKADKNSYPNSGFKQTLLVCLFNLIAIINTQANIDFNDNCKRIYLQIQHLEIEEAKKHITLEKINAPNNNALAYLEHFLYFVSIFNSENKVHYTLYKEKNIALFDKIVNDPYESPYKRYLLSDMYLHRSILAFKEKEFIPFAKYFNNSYQLIKQNQSIYRDFEPNNKISGIMELALSHIPPQFDWIGKMLGYQGNREKGLEHLNAFFNSCEKNNFSFLRAESYFIQLILQMNYFDDLSQTSKILEKIKLTDDLSIKNNPFVIYAQTLAYIYTGKSNEALSLLFNKKQLNIMTFYKGLLLLYKLDMDAEKYLKLYAYSENQHFIASAFQKLAWHRLLQSDTIGFKEYMQSSLMHGNNLLESDKNAIKEAKSGIIPNVALLRARLLFDGGYYSKALDEMRAINTSSDLQKSTDYLEYIYRFARIYHKLNDLKTAEQYYNQVLLLGENENAYFYVYSLLQLGIIADKLGNKQKAIKYFQHCLIFGHNDDYQSIKQQAAIKLYQIEHQ